MLNLGLCWNRQGLSHDTCNSIILQQSLRWLIKCISVSYLITHRKHAFRDKHCNGVHRAVCRIFLLGGPRDAARIVVGEHRRRCEASGEGLPQKILKQLHVAICSQRRFPTISEAERYTVLTKSNPWSRALPTRRSARHLQYMNGRHTRDKRVRSAHPAHILRRCCTHDARFCATFE
jgi:hypothetical protein